jgi:transcriptional regulator with AAA-type ATPase domain
MAPKRLNATRLARLLNSVDRPIYVLDDQYTVVFANVACLDWIGPSGEGLVGSRAAYHSEPDVAGPEAVAAGLCPPPEAMTGRERTANVYCRGEDGQLRRRRARFFPLEASPDASFGLIAILDDEDLAEPETAPEPLHEPGPAELHDQIVRFRRGAAGRYRADRLLGDSPAMRRARRQIEVAAASRASVLLVGPPGSGRRHTAGAIHYGRAEPSGGSFVPLSCAVLSAELIHSTVRALGSGDALGKESEHSTLLLGDVDQLPPEGQVLVAGELVDRPFPLRLISTARRPLVELAGQGAFREDLAAALSTIMIELPPLAERREDVPLLAQRFLEERNAQSPQQLAGFTPEALDALCAHRWPGNVDELAKVVAAAHRRSAGPSVDVPDLPEEIHLAADAAAHPPRRDETIVLDDYLAEIERELIRRALAVAKGNKAKAARLLGVSRPRLLRRAAQLGLEPPCPPRRPSLK